MRLGRGCPAPVYAEASTGFSVLGRRSFSEGGKAGHDELYWNTPFHRLHLSQTLRSAKIGA